jgi:hypothetical protein
LNPRNLRNSRLFAGLVAILAIVLLPVDIPAGSVQNAIQLPGFLLRDLAVGFRLPFGDANSCFLFGESTRFISRQFSAPHSLSDPGALGLLAPVDGVGREQRSTQNAGEQNARDDLFHNRFSLLRA